MFFSQFSRCMKGLCGYESLSTGTYSSVWHKELSVLSKARSRQMAFSTTKLQTQQLQTKTYFVACWDMVVCTNGRYCYITPINHLFVVYINHIEDKLYLQCYITLISSTEKDFKSLIFLHCPCMGHHCYPGNQPCGHALDDLFFCEAIIKVYGLVMMMVCP